MEDWRGREGHLPAGSKAELPALPRPERRNLREPRRVETAESLRSSSSRKAPCGRISRSLSGTALALKGAHRKRPPLAFSCSSCLCRMTEVPIGLPGTLRARHSKGG